MTNGQKLRQILSKPGILVLPGVYDCIGAKLVERSGFEVVFTSGFSISASSLGLPDYGFLTETEMIWSVSRIIKSVKIPVVADIDTGYGNHLNVIKTVRDIVEMGVAGIILEDQQWPKRCGHFEGKQVVDIEEHSQKIRAADYARGHSGLVIVARTDSRANFGLEDAINRGRAYHKAGADVIFIEAPQSVEELREISKSFPDVTLFANMVEGGKTPIISAIELEQLGFKIVVFPLSGLFSATSAMMECFRFIKDHRTTEGFENKISFGEFEQLIGLNEYKELEKLFSPPKQ